MECFRILEMSECCYRNESSKMVILKCIGESQFFCEKVIMPSELHIFEAPADARLEFWHLKGGQPMLHSTAEASQYAVLSSSRAE